ncbi:MFS transporter [uncultured Oscillibacter sp.]|uniref:MFS transporter n=1 Tax=uncultured Oscillibacter sp. TaxID=876091 RepID=UPI0025E0232E|nr:MFS transporter [uncultured Oscillibacter sp.]
MSLPSLRRVNTLYILVQLFYWAAFAAFAGYQTALLLGRGFSSGEAGVFAAIRCLAGIVAQPLLGGWADRHPRVPLKHLLNGCLAASLAVNLLFYTTRPGFWGTVLIFLALGVLELNAYPLLDSMAVQFINAGLDVNYSLGRGLGSFAYAVACVILGRQSAAWGVETVLLTHMALLVLLMAAIAAYPAAPPAVPTGERERPHSVWALLRGNRSFTLMLLAVFCALTAVMPIVSFLVNIVTSRGGNETHLGLALFLMAASELPAALLFPRLWRRLGSRGMMVLSVVCMAAKPLVFLLVPSLGLLLLVQPIQMLGYGLFTPASVYYANENVSAADRVRGQTVMMVASNGLGGMAGNLIAGYAIDLGGVNAMLALCAAVGAAGVLLAAAATRCEKTA